MALTSENARRWSGAGAVFVDFTGNASLPNDATTQLDANFRELGYITDTGITVTQNADVSQVYAWQNGDNIRTLQTTHDATVSFEMAEWNEDTAKVYFGDAGAITGEMAPRLQWVIQAFDDDNTLRLVIPSGQVTEKGDWTLTNTGLSILPVTITCYPDSDGKKIIPYFSPVLASS